MNYEDLSKEVKGMVAYVAQNLDMMDATEDLNEAMYYKCRLVDVNMRLAGRIGELAEEYCNDNDLPVDLWEQTFEDEEDLLGFAIEYDALYGSKRYRFTVWDTEGNEDTTWWNESDIVITLIAGAESNPKIMAYSLERDGEEIINTSNRVKHED